MSRYITIEREYGSGGRKIAQKLSEVCHIPWYGREILLRASENLHLPVEQLEEYEESTANSFFYTVALIGKAHSSDPDLLMRDGSLFVAEQEAIRQLASGGSAIFLGHCACEALKGEEGLVRVFIKSNLEARKKRAVEEYGVNADKAEEILHRFDKRRSCYYSVNTAQKWRDLSLYDVVLDSSVLGVRGCVEALEGIMRD